MDSHPESPPSRREQELAEELNEVARARFGDKVGPVVVAHLNLQGVDCESDLRYVDTDQLLATAQTSGLNKVQIVKLHDWVIQVQQSDAGLEERLTLALRTALRAGLPPLPDESPDGWGAAAQAKWEKEVAARAAESFRGARQAAAQAAEASMAASTNGQGTPAGILTPTAEKASAVTSGKTSLRSSFDEAAQQAEMELLREKARRSQELQALAFQEAADQEQQKAGCLMFDPTTARRLSWDLCVILPLLAYLTVMMPFRMCFENEPTGFMYYMETTFDMLFIFDIFVNFRTGYVEEATGLVIFDYRKVALNYMKTWFILDTVSGIPFGLLNMPSLSQIQAIKVLKSSRILKAVKLMRFLKLSRLIKGMGIMNRLDPNTVDRIEDFLADGATRTGLRIIRILFIMGYVCHLMACLWTFAGRSADLDGKNSWLAMDLQVFTAADTTGGPKVMKIYLGAFYYSLTTMTTVGYGDVHPYSNLERIVAMFLMLNGGFMYAYIVSSLTSIVTMEDSNAKHAREKLDAVASYIVKMDLPQDLGRRVRRYFRARKAEAMDERAILMDLSPSIRAEVSEYLVESGMLSEVMIFKQMSSVYWPRILPLLRAVPLMRGEVVCREGEDVIECFIVIEGQLEGTTSFSPLALRKNMSLGSSFADAVDAQEEQEGGGVRRRLVGASGMVNTLCVLKVWAKAVETVTAVERTDAYSVASEDFFATFKDDEDVMAKIQEFTCKTQYHMDTEHPDKINSLGVPLFVLSDSEAKLREAEYRNELRVKKKERQKHWTRSLKKAKGLAALTAAARASSNPASPRKSGGPANAEALQGGGGGGSGGSGARAGYGAQEGGPGPQSAALI